MFVYKNTSRITKTFHGVTFRPGETHEVPGYINDPKFIRVKNVDAVAQKPAKSGSTAKKSNSVKVTATSSVAKVSKPETKKPSASNNDTIEQKEGKNNG